MTVAAVDIWNQALGHVGVGQEVQSTTEGSVVSIACQRYYDPARQELLRAYPWPFATATASLALVASNPTIEWGFAYALPSDCLLVRRILGWTRAETRKDRVPFRLVGSATGKVLYSDWQDTTNGTWVEYVQDVTDTTRFDPDFVLSLSYLLASYIGSRVTSGDPFKLADRAATFRERAMSIASAAAQNEEQPDQAPESEFITSRDDAQVPFWQWSLWPK